MLPGRRCHEVLCAKELSKSDLLVTGQLGAELLTALQLESGCHQRPDPVTKGAETGLGMAGLGVGIDA